MVMIILGIIFVLFGAGSILYGSINNGYDWSGNSGIGTGVPFIIIGVIILIIGIILVIAGIIKYNKNKGKILQKDNVNIDKQNNANSVDKLNIGFTILSIIIPLAGLILWRVWKKDTPIKAKYCGIGALIGIILYSVIQMLFIKL